MCDICRQLETDIERYRRLLERSPHPLTLEIQRFRKLLDLGLDLLTIEQIERVIQKLVQHKSANALAAKRLGTNTDFPPRRGRGAAGLPARVIH
jgi:hypothetical protein